MTHELLPEDDRVTTTFRQTRKGWRYVVRIKHPVVYGTISGLAPTEDQARALALRSRYVAIRMVLAADKPTDPTT